jgi:outer membrane autotransporter protein
MMTSRVDASESNDKFTIKSRGLTAGVEYGFGAGVVGLAANYSKPKASFGNDAARSKGDSMQLGGYAAMGFGGAFAQGYLGYGKDDHEIRRAGVVDAMSADADGTHWIAGAKAGYLMPLGAISVGPVVAIDYARAKVDGYTEEGDAALTLNVGSTRARSMRGSIGAELRGNIDMGGLALRPYGSLVMEKELSDSNRSVSFAQTSAPGIVNSWEFDDASKKAYLRFSGGLSAAVMSNVSVDGAVSMGFGDDHGDESSAHVGLKVGF